MLWTLNQQSCTQCPFRSVRTYFANLGKVYRKVGYFPWWFQRWRWNATHFFTPYVTTESVIWELNIMYLTDWGNQPLTFKNFLPRKWFNFLITRVKKDNRGYLYCFMLSFSTRPRDCRRKVNGCHQHAKMRSTAVSNGWYNAEIWSKDGRLNSTDGCKHLQQASSARFFKSDRVTDTFSM